MNFTVLHIGHSILFTFWTSRR